MLKRKDRDKAARAKPGGAKAGFRELKDDEEAVPAPATADDYTMDLSLIFKPPSGPIAMARIAVVWLVFALYASVLAFFTVRTFVQAPPQLSVTDRWQLRVCPDVSVHTPAGSGTFADVLKDPTVHEFTIQMSGQEQPVIFVQSSLIQLIGHHFLTIVTLNTLTIGRGRIEMTIMDDSERDYDEREWQTVLIDPPRCEEMKTDALRLVRTLFRAARRHGLLSMDPREHLVEFEHMTAPVATDEPLATQPFHWAWSFVWMSTIMVFLATFFVRHVLRARITYEFTKTASEFGEAYFKFAIEHGGFEKIAFDALGPMFLADTIFGDPVENARSWVKGIISAFILSATSLVFTLPCICMIVSPVLGAEYTLGLSALLFVWAMLASSHATQYLLLVPWRIRRRVARLYTAGFHVLVFLAAYQCFLWVFWLIVAIQLNPLQVATVLTTAGSALLYSFITIVKIKAVLSDDVLPLVSRAQSELLFSRWELVAALIWSMIIIAVLAIVLLVGWVLLDWEAREVSGAYTAGLADGFKIFLLPITAFIESKRSDKAVQERLGLAQDAKRKQEERKEAEAATTKR